VPPSFPAAPREAVPAEPPPPAGGAWADDAAPPSLARGLPAHEQAVIDAALAILGRRVREPGAVIDAPHLVREFLRLQLAKCGRERFGVLFLDGQHAAIGFEVLFEGTLTQTSVYPREVVRRSMQLNAAAVILVHNHPSGAAEPSRADEYLTATIRQALGLVDVRVLDHVIVGWPDVTSFAERGLMEPPAPWRSEQAARTG
jgi:DNA repair protein RadC